LGRVKVLYIAGEGRSGSTVLAALLGTWPRFVSVGEIRGVWRALETEERCGCGEPFLACPFWRRVGDEAFGGWRRVDYKKLIAIDEELARHRHVARGARGPHSRRYGTSYAYLVDALSRLYAGVASVSDGATIVDSTKDPQYALLLSGASVDLRLVHLVRDSRGVAFSWAKPNVARPQYADHSELRGTPMNTMPAWRSAAEWSAKNLMLHALSTRRATIRVRYEDLFPDACVELARILRLADRLDLADDIEQRESALTSFEALPLHTVGGNRVRFERGILTLKRDDEWKSRMARRERRVVTALTFPLLMAYGYPISPS